MLEEYLPFFGLIIFIIVLIWLVLGTVLTSLAIEYANIITFIGGLAIFILGVEAVYAAIKDIKSKGSE